MRLTFTGTISPLDDFRISSASSCQLMGGQPNLTVQRHLFQPVIVKWFAFSSVRHFLYGAIQLNGPNVSLVESRLFGWNTGYAGCFIQHMIIISLSFTILGG